MSNTITTYIEFSGLPETGKTASIRALSVDLTNQGIQCEVISGSTKNPLFCHLKSNWVFDAWLVCKMAKDLIEGRMDAQNKLTIFDRGLIDTLCWIEWFRMRGEIKSETALAVERFARIPEWFDKVKLTVVLRATFETALQRKGNTGRIVNFETYRELSRAYETVLGKLSSAHNAPNIYVIDTDNLSITEICDLVLLRLKELTNL